MTFDEIKNKVSIWDNSLSSHERKSIHLSSFVNFIYHFKELSENSQHKVLPLFGEYITLVESMNFNFTKEESYEIAKTFLDKTANFYKDIGFALNMKLSFVFFWGIIVDLILFLLNFLPKKNGIPIPIVTLLLFIYYLYVTVFKKSKKKAYGIFY